MCASFSIPRNVAPLPNFCHTNHKSGLVYQCKNPIVPEEGWFGQPKYGTFSKNHPTFCRFLLLYSSLMLQQELITWLHFFFAFDEERVHNAVEIDIFRIHRHQFNSHLLTLLLPFLSDQLGDTKTIRPFALKGHGSIHRSGGKYPTLSPTLR